MSRLQSGFRRWEANATPSMLADFAALRRATRDQELAARALRHGEILDTVLLFRILHLRMAKQQKAGGGSLNFATKLGYPTSSAVDSAVSELGRGESGAAFSDLKATLARSLPQATLVTYSQQ